MDNHLDSKEKVVEEIMRIHRSLPSRPEIEDVETATSLIQNVEKEDRNRLEAIDKQIKPSSDVPLELFNVLKEMKKSLVNFQSKEQRRESTKILDLESVHVVFDELIQRASFCIASPNGTSTTSLPRSVPVPSPVVSSDEIPFKSKEIISRDDTFVKKVKSSFYSDGLLAPRKPQVLDSTFHQAKNVTGHDGEKLSLIKLASLIEVSAKKATPELNLQHKLMDQLEWLPDSLGKLSSLVRLDLSENCIMVLPATIGGLLSLTKLDLHSNRIGQLPESIGDLLNLVNLNLSGNQLPSLPSAFSRLIHLEELDLSSNSLTILPESIGSLVSLKKLDVETNNIEEIPHSISGCSFLKELRADYNRLKALPEAVGKLSTLEILTVRYNNIRQLPTTISSMANLKELDVSFNELESVPESLCYAKTLVKLNIGNNFANLRSLPGLIGNLEKLEELDMSNNQIRFLPYSFKTLSQLRVLHTEQNPLEELPKDITEKGAQAVVQYMNDLVEARNTKSQRTKPKKSWFNSICFFCKSSTN
ncbi:Leucine-rich repeat [Arabidopsis thaliana x Arabidopsis arenosa]|uniref:Leucine-rich repeat n=1 Tax=Arabidopsis thaliana x Arabidopsis arenosa TaxID=1240361 RepID=A0A8T2B686_9BRAS|nr:Leucine-rich repeat [Arabidopsis thaliana x Arabidopsis arenosa]KAG7579483.1 Leucine-rich repeat [Arabidopsis thaliana x Arabidopsis arenosa]KAG7579484.1 Leucine-rich repeat [Arabidopsis thaliana x Arabidopsis arenosa]